MRKPFGLDELATAAQRLVAVEPSRTGQQH
jgi:hypothetical protein